MCGGARFALPAAIHDERLRLFWEYWHAKRAALGQIPGRQHIDPAAMRAFLANIILFDVERNSQCLRFRVRLMGTDVVELFGGEATGCYLHETVPPKIYSANLGRLSSIVETHQPVYGVQAVPRENRSFIKYEHLTVPLAADGTNVDMLLGVRCGVPASRRAVP